MIEPIDLHLDGTKFARAVMPGMMLEIMIKSDEEFQQRLKEHEAYRKLDSKSIKYCYCCKECNAELWLSFHDIMHQTDKPFMPCGHGWNKLGTRQAGWEAFKRHNPINTVVDGGN